MSASIRSASVGLPDDRLCRLALADHRMRFDARFPHGLGGLAGEPGFLGAISGCGVPRRHAQDRDLRLHGVGQIGRDAKDRLGLRREIRCYEKPHDLLSLRRLPEKT
jgi:hypothetical protein